MARLADRYRRLKMGVAGLTTVVLLVTLASLLGTGTDQPPIGGPAPEAPGLAAPVAAPARQAPVRTAPAPARTEPPLDANRSQSPDALPAPVAPGQQVPDLEPDPALD